MFLTKKQTFIFKEMFFKFSNKIFLLKLNSSNNHLNQKRYFMCNVENFIVSEWKSIWSLKKRAIGAHLKKGWENTSQENVRIRNGNGTNCASLSVDCAVVDCFEVRGFTSESCRALAFSLHLVSGARFHYHRRIFTSQWKPLRVCSHNK